VRTVRKVQRLEGVIAVQKCDPQREMAAGRQERAQKNLQSASRWLVVYTKPRHEKTVARHFQQRAIAHFFPIYAVTHTWRNGLHATVELPLFPSYIFVKITPRLRIRVLEVPGVLAFVLGAGGEPAAFSNGLIEALQKGLAARAVEPHPVLTVGQKARIRSGALAGMEGVVTQAKNGLRVILTVEHILRSVSVEVMEEDLELLCSEEAGQKEDANNRL